MISHRVSLSRIIAVNWYGFRQMIDVNNNILISGAYGTGKSVLLDLLQYVLLGEHWRPNRAAAGNARGRSLVSYCLCDTNTTREGEPHYLRRSGASVIGLEFTWPAEPGKEPRRETWGMRVEFSSPDAEPKRTYFGIPDRITWEMIAPGGKLRSEDEFRTFFRREYGHDVLLPTHRTYLEEMATPKHLYFDRDQLNKTLWKSIAFEPEADVEAFIRDFVLEESPVDVTEVKRSVAAYRETQRVLELQEAECGLLDTICTHDGKLRHARKEEAFLRHLGLALDQTKWEEAVRNGTLALEALDARHAEDKAKFDEALERQKQLEGDLNRFTLDRDDSDLLAAQEKQKTLGAKVEALSDAQRTVRERLADLGRRWQRWLQRGREVPLEGLADTLNDDDALIDALLASDEREGIDALPKLANSYNTIVNRARELLLPVEAEIKVQTDRLQTLARDLEKLQLDETPGTFPLLQAIKAKGDKSAVEQLCRMVEVKPEAEEWRSALEMFLGRHRFAIVTPSSETYQAALDLLRKQPSGPRGMEEAVIHPREAQELATTVRKDSLAGKIEVRAASPEMTAIAEGFVRHLLGPVAAVERMDDLEKCEQGITRDGLLKQSPTRRRLRQMPGFEYTLGQEGLKRLAEMLIREQRERMATRAGLEEQRNQVRAWIDEGKQGELDRVVLPSRIGEISQLPELEAELSEVLREIEYLETPERAQRLESRQQMQRDLAAANQQIGALRTAQDQYQISRSQREETLCEDKESLNRAQIAAQQSHGALPIGITTAEIASRLDAFIASYKNWPERERAVANAASAAGNACNNAWNERNNARLALQNATDEEGRPKFPHWRFEDPGEEGNDRWQSRYELLGGTEIPTYRKLAGERRQDWERRLKDQVLNRLNEHLQQAERTVRLLRTYLDQPVGRYLYRVTQRRDPAFVTLWKLLDSGFEPTDELLAASRNEETQSALDELMQAVELGNKAEGRLQRLLDYRQYHRYDLEAIQAAHAGRADAPSISLGRSGKNLSGGENQAPFFISMLAAYRRVYDLGGGRAQHIGLVVMDEAFSKLSGDGVEDCLALAAKFNLQLLMAFPIDRLGVMARFAETTILCRKEEEHDAQGYKTRVENVPILLTSEQALEAVS